MQLGWVLCGNLGEDTAVLKRTVVGDQSFHNLNEYLAYGNRDINHPQLAYHACGNDLNDFKWLFLYSPPLKRKPAEKPAWRTDYVLVSLSQSGKMYLSECWFLTGRFALFYNLIRMFL